MRPSPHQGGSTAIITGRNFGSSGPDPVIVFKRDDNTQFVCGPGDVVSRSPTSIQITLPEGSGAGLSVSVTVGGQVGTLDNALSYDPPVIDSMLAIGGGPGGANVSVTGVAGSGPRPTLVARAVGGYVLQLVGRNFGLSSDVQCVKVTWQGSLGGPGECDGQETFVGEGELPVASLLSYSHTLVEVLVPPGLGTMNVTVYAYNQGPVVTGQLQYAAPVLNATNVTLFSTDGGTFFGLSGVNFGPPTFLGQKSVWTPQPLPLNSDTRPVTALLVVWFHNKCAVTPLSVAGQAVPLALQACSPVAITARGDGLVSVASLSGIGMNRTLTVSVVEPTSAGSATLRWINATAPLVFSFAPPQIKCVGLGAWGPGGLGGWEWN
jgi:hypothetical protein